MEYCPNGSLADYIQKEKTIPYELTRFYAGEIVAALGKQSHQ